MQRKQGGSASLLGTVASAKAAKTLPIKSLKAPESGGEFAFVLLHALRTTHSPPVYEKFPSFS